ncbi:MAG: amidohydrolase family protein [Spirochaetales bacterium]|jgi:predicted amidohydrolase|nr:amidohydrolase family protein [Spirochaetales bacterium]
MKLDLLVRNGHVVDPLQNIDGKMDIGVKNGVITPAPLGTEAVCSVDASGLYVFPGLIDFHTHIFHTGSAISVNPAFLPPTGVTAAVDAGTAGCTNFRAFYEGVISSSPVLIKSYLNVYGAGQPDTNIQEKFDPAEYRPAQIKRLVETYTDTILGLKIRYSKGIAASLEALKETLRIARELKLKVCVHTTNPPSSLDGVAELLEKDDVYCHAYQGMGEETILDAAGGIRESIHKARSRGVIFDSANGRSNFSFPVALAAMKQGFHPDIISTDWTLDKLNYSPHAKNLPYLMAKFLTMGMSLREVVRAVTQTPARLMGLEGKIGTLRPGARGDIAVFKKISQRIVHQDFAGRTYETKELFLPQLVAIGGELVFCQGDFALAE